jgi:hypothetical protein
LPAALSANDLGSGQTEILNLCQLKTINYHQARSIEDSVPDSIPDIKKLLACNTD